MNTAAATPFQNCVEAIFARLTALRDVTILEECGESGKTKATGGDLLAMVVTVRERIRAAGAGSGDRCGLLAENGIRWVAANLAIFAEGLICVPLYSRQAPEEIAAMLADCEPALLLCGSAALRDSVHAAGARPPLSLLFDEVFTGPQGELSSPPRHLAVTDPMTIIYTSGTSGVSKGVLLTVGNVTHMLACTSSRLDSLMQGRSQQDRVFHYLPFCFAGSWILLLTSLLQGSILTLNTALTRLAGDLSSSAPDYVLNVPALLERMRRGVDDQVAAKGGMAYRIYSNAKRAVQRRQGNSVAQSTASEGLWLWLANLAVFPAIRKKMLGPNIRALICGSAPLAPETQLYFQMLGVPVLQVYGLTETTAICTMDDPSHVVPGRVGPAIPGVEMRLSDNQEILVRGPNVFACYWNRPAETAAALRDGWFHTGDQGEVNTSGNWTVAGRLKNLVILSSGHNVAPEPIEDKLLQQIPEALQVLVVGNGRGFLSAVVCSPAPEAAVQNAINAINTDLPHYKQVRAFCLRREGFSIESGLLTANGKLKRDAITKALQDEINAMYEARARVAS